MCSLQKVSLIDAREMADPHAFLERGQGSDADLVKASKYEIALLAADAGMFLESIYVVT